MPDDGPLCAKTRCISSPITRAIDVVVFDGQVLCLIDNIKAQVDGPHQISVALHIIIIILL